MKFMLIIRAKYGVFRANGIYHNYSKKGDDCVADSTANISIRMDADLKAQAGALFGGLGFEPTNE